MGLAVSVLKTAVGTKTFLVFVSWSCHELFWCHALLLLSCPFACVCNGIQGKMHGLGYWCEVMFKTFILHLRPFHVQFV